MIDFSKPTIMGILNVTPDSFSDGGRFNSLNSALNQVEKMIAEGADIIDIGGESTRPGADRVSIDEELNRVVPVIEAITKRFDTIISIDTSKPQVMDVAIKSGAHLINDVNALQAEGAVDIASQLNVPVCLMHMQGNPKNMQSNPRYTNIIEEVCYFLKQRTEVCLEAGIKKKNILLDPGFGFGKTYEHNIELLAGLNKISELGYPVLVGLSRKSLLDKMIARKVDQRLAGSISLAIIALQNSAKIFRVHDVAETIDALKVAQCFTRN
ncbi:MAG: dihydropteroate synthase [Gammaproteobacteria bacterium]|nr:dihydropteroate synthase [Gammaproteobacteria bacterium]